eukprot:830311-Amphidinium_carterae.1
MIATHLDPTAPYSLSLMFSQSVLVSGCRVSTELLLSAIVVNHSSLFLSMIQAWALSAEARAGLARIDAQDQARVGQDL